MLLIAFFVFNDTATTEIYTLSLHDALPICVSGRSFWRVEQVVPASSAGASSVSGRWFQSAREVVLACLAGRSEEHTSELQSRQYLVCRLLLEKKKNKKYNECTVHHLYPRCQ